MRRFSSSYSYIIENITEVLISKNKEKEVLDYIDKSLKLIEILLSINDIDFETSDAIKSVTQNINKLKEGISNEEIKLIE